MTLALLSLLFLSGVGAWFISTVAAGGAAMLLLPTLGLFITADILIPTVSLAALTANPTRAWTFRQHIHWPVVAWLVPGSIFGALIGTWVFSRLEPFWIQCVLAVFLISTVWQFRFGKRKKSFPMPLWGFFNCKIQAK